MRTSYFYCSIFFFLMRMRTNMYWARQGSIAFTCIVSFSIYNIYVHENIIISIYRFQEVTWNVTYQIGKECQGQDLNLGSIWIESCWSLSVSVCIHLEESLSAWEVSWNKKQKTAFFRCLNITKMARYVIARRI